MLSSLIFICISAWLTPVNAVSCLDDDGTPVEWFVGYKFPNSYEYAFLKRGSYSWRKSNYMINEGGMLKNTFEAMYALRDQENAFYGMYNDEKPKEDSNGYWWGHMKGAFAFEENHGGFWIIHSIPKLSEVEGSYRYPQTGRVYGQHFFCVSLPNSAIKGLIKQLSVARPLIQDYYLAKTVAKRYEGLDDLLNNKRITHEDQAVVSFYSIYGSLTMEHFSKSSEYHKDLYSDLVSPNLRFGMQVESWQHGNPEPSVCNTTDLKVLNIRQLKFHDLDISFTSYHDHAKWAVTLLPRGATNYTSPMWICLGDINREYSQFHRGGGTMCIQKNEIWTAFNSLITDVEPCSRRS